MSALPDVDQAEKRVSGIRRIFARVQSPAAIEAVRRYVRTYRLRCYKSRHGGRHAD